MRILRSNLETALRLAIAEAEGEWTGTFDEDSTFIDGLREVLKASQQGETITIKDE